MINRSKGNVESTHDIMMDLRAIVVKWNLGRGDIGANQAMQDIETILINYQRRVWAREH